jgi:cell division protein FtsI (penicillin-binding protein 3)
LSDYLAAFGFGSLAMGKMLGREEAGIVWSRTRWDDSTLASNAIGYQIGVTLLQLTTAFAVFANDGVYVRPTVLPQTEQFDPKVTRRVISEQTARDIRRVLSAAARKDAPELADDILLGGIGGSPLQLQSGRYSDDVVNSTYLAFAEVNASPIAIGVLLTTPDKAETSDLGEIGLTLQILALALRHPHLGSYSNTFAE